MRAASTPHDRARRHVLRIACALVLLGCGCSYDPPTPGTRDEQAVVLLSSSVRNLDPRFTVDSVSMNVSRLVFSNLVNVDNAQVRPQLDLATAIEPDPTSRDDRGRATRYIVSLRRDVLWHDGTPFTARDVVYTYQSILDPALGSPYHGGFRRKLVAVRDVPGDPYRVVFELKEPYATFVTDLVMGIVPAHVLEPRTGDPPGRFREGEAIGTGPFRLHSRIAGRRLVLERFEDFYGGAPPTRYLVFRTIADEGTRLLSLAAGSADLLAGGLSPVLLDVVADQPGLVVESAPGLSWTYLAFNLRDPVVGDLRVRRAIQLAVDPAEIVRRKLEGRAELSVGMLSSVSWGHPDALAPPQPNPARAEALLDAAGYRPDPETGVRLTLELKISNDRFRRSVARTLSDQLARVGVAVDVKSYEAGTFLADVRSGSFQSTVLILPEPSEPDMLRWMFHSRNTPDAAPAAQGLEVARLDRRFLVPGLSELLESDDAACADWARREVSAGVARWCAWQWGRELPRDRANRTYYTNPWVDCWLMRAWEEPDPEVRAPLYRRAQAVLARELPVVPLWHEHNVIVRSVRLHGYEILPNGRLASLARVTLSAR